jgi:hypothetical protein
VQLFGSRLVGVALDTERLSDGEYLKEEGQVTAARVEAARDIGADQRRMRGEDRGERLAGTGHG